MTYFDYTMLGPTFSWNVGLIGDWLDIEGEDTEIVQAWITFPDHI